MLCENPDGEFRRNVERMKQAEQAMTEHVYNERLKRAQNTRSYKVQDFQPGDLVFVWRVQTRGPARGPAVSARTGGFTGPCRALATETRRTEDGQFRPGSCVWVIRGSRLIKAHPKQLRKASVREELVEELANPVELPWTITKLTEDLGERQYDDVTEEIPDEMEWEQARDEERSAPFRRVRRKRQVPECPRPSVEVEGGEERDQFGHLVVTEHAEMFRDHYAESFWGGGRDPHSHIPSECEAHD